MKRRETEALRIYEPLEHLVNFHSCTAPERMLSSGNRAGKTLTAAVEFARCVTGQDPFDKYPKENGSAVIVGADGRHLADPLFNLLFQPGALRMIKENGVYKLYKPWIHGERIKTSPAAPLIPPRFVKHHFWLSKKGNIPKATKLKNGWEIKWFSSEGKPPQGIRVHYAWFDEEIIDPNWYTEIAARLVDYRGYFVWSATPQKGGMQFHDLSEEAERQREFTVPRVVRFKSHISKNPYFTNEQRELFFGKLTEEQFRIRVEGETEWKTYLVYDFNPHLHLVPSFEVPAEWMRIMVVDPGRQVCAVLFAAVPPPSFDDPGAVYLYDELYIRKCDAHTFASEVRKKTHQQPEFDTFLIDWHGAQLHDIGTGQSVQTQYEAALAEHGVRCRRTGSNFLAGCDEIKGGIEKFRSWMLPRLSTGTPKVRIMFGRLPMFAWELNRYHYKKVRSKQGDQITDEPEQKNIHLMDCARYLAMFDPKYRPPKPRSSSARIAAFVKKKIAKRKRADAMSNEALTWNS